MLHSKRGGWLLAMGAAAVVGCALDARAVTLTLRAVADTTIYNDNTTGGNGLGQHIFVGRTNNGGVRRGAIRFEIDQIPPGSTITSASLAMFVSQTQAANTIGLHRATVSWGEGASNASGTESTGTTAEVNDATWLHRFYPDTFWTTPGGDFEAVANVSVAASGTNSTTTWSGAGLITDLTVWMNNPAQNFGWILKGNEATRSAKRFNSSDHLTVNTRPLLTVTFTPSVPMGACCLPVTGECQLRSQANCLSLGGNYSGDNTTCAPNPCPEPVGACCLNNGSCVDTVPSNCTTLGGMFRYGASACATVACPVVLTPFVDALPIPSVATPVSGVPSGAAHYEIEMTEFTQQLHRDLPPTRLWGYNGTYPGPTIEARAGQPVTVVWKNNLRTTTGDLRTTHLLPIDTCLHGPDATGGLPVTVVHVHGAKTDPLSDGDPDLSFPPGQESPVHTYPNDQLASTLWYHDHGLGLTRLNVYMGLAGFFLVRDAAEDALNIPRGEYEVPLVIQDRTFAPDGSLQYHQDWQEHFFGDTVLVNGKVWPYLNVKKGKYRFRLLNGSNSRAYTLSLSDASVFNQISTDQGLLPGPSLLSSITLLPSERVDIVIDFAGYETGEEIELLNTALSPYPAGGQGPDIENVMQFRVVSATGDQDPLPGVLTTFQTIPESQAVRSRMFELQSQFDVDCGHERWRINGLLWDDITEFPRFNTTEIWSWVNRSNVSHPMHVHLVSFQVLDRQNFEVVGGVITPTSARVLPPASERGWKDTVNATPNQITRVIMRFNGFKGLFPYHCHILEHEDHEMMRQFRVVCVGDANYDNVTNAADLSVLLSQWNQQVLPGSGADFNHDGIVNGADLSVLLGWFGTGC